MRSAQCGGVGGVVTRGGRPRPTTPHGASGGVASPPDPSPVR
eukprot:gene13158-1196_t